MLPNKKNATNFFYLDFDFFWPFFNQKQPKLTKNEENWQNLNCLMKFSGIWYVDASQQKNATKVFFKFRPFLAVFNQKTAKIDQK